MLYKTRGIVFKSTDYSESSLVVQVFTEEFGIQSYLVNGAKKPKAKIRQNMFQPLQLLEMVVYHKQSGNIQRIKEVKNSPPFGSIPFHFSKSSIILFLNEVLYKAIRHQGQDPALFQFVFHGIELLDRLDEGLANFHLFFLLRLSQFLGFYPHQGDTAVNADYFDLQTGSFSQVAPPHTFVLQQPDTGYWNMLLKGNFETLANLSIPAARRRILLEKILDYYKLHIDGFTEVKSHHVLEEVLS
ncbi:MAG: recO [Sphingobacteriaceae bacterium]|jgi:DNA repair protein RecO (recombination protein O)|nr:recO [Sphingobacteriaceae bacterium]